MMRRRRIVCCIILLALVACGQPGRAIVAKGSASGGESAPVQFFNNGIPKTIPPGSSAEWDTTEAYQPANPATPAVIEWSDGHIAAVTGYAYRQAWAFAGGFWFSLLGMAVATGGLAIVLARRAGALWVAPVPRTVGRACIVGGLAIAILPYFLEQWGWTIPVGIGLVLLLYFLKYLHNRKGSLPWLT